MLVIGIHGPMGAGKSTIANMIGVIAHGPVEIIPFAKGVKDAARSLGWNGEKDEKGRRLLQLIGTECGRECIDPDIWVKKWKKTVNDYFFEHPTGIVVVDDLRFFNEYIGVRSNPHYHLIKIKGRGYQYSLAFKIKCWITKHLFIPLVHKSELPLQDCYFDSIIHNDGDKFELEEEVTHILAKALHGAV